MLPFQSIFFKEQFGVEPLLDPEDMATTAQVAYAVLQKKVDCVALR